MVEGLVVIPTFLILFAGLVFAFNLYDTKLRMMRLARESAWDYAMCSCGTQGDAPSTACQTPEAQTENNKSAGEPPTQAPPTSGSSNPLNSSKIGTVQAPVDTTSRDMGSYEAALSQTITPGGWVGSFQTNVTSRTKVMCNEVPYDGSLMGWIKNAGQVMTSW
jgi:hypothetical protein